MSQKVFQFVVEGASLGQRLDRVLPGMLEKEGVSISRAVIQDWIKSGGVSVNELGVKPRHAVSTGDLIEVILPDEKPAELAGEMIDLEVLFEDDDVIVINKDPGMVVHPASGNADGTLVNALIHHTGGNLSKLADSDRPGIVHRLDKDTSGCIVAAKSDRAYESLVAQFSGRETGKEYLAVTQGVPTSQSGTLKTQIGRHPVNRQKMAILEAPAGKEAVTDYRILHADEAAKWALLSCVIHTGRTHQIRVHLKEGLHCPILGDVIYGQPKRQVIESTRLMLHAWKLSFTHPSGVRMSFEAPIPESFQRFKQ
ncbi:MAG: RluA family pseudouridine synthase [Verrucomicrobiales bacterium]|nr:RluA family pseudouridine synthase [Verrucomicrobiales bacterium]